MRAAATAPALGICVLGPLEVVRDGRPIVLHGQKQRALLAILVLRANRLVASDELIEELWDTTPPATAANTLQVYVSQLRRALGADAIRTRAPGYELGVDADIDAERFERLAADGRGALRDGDAATAAARLRAALELWRGEPLEEFRYARFAQAERARLEEARLVALEDLYEAELAAGGTAELVPQLQRLAADHPLRERLRRHLVLALYRAGRQADALHEFRRARQELVEELALEPGPELRGLEQAILRQDPRLDALPEGPPLPRLPVAATTLVGREQELLEAEALLRAPDVRLVTLTGPGGIGKTRLALELAHRLSPAFEHGAAFVDLAPISRASLVGPTILRALGRPVTGGNRAALERFLAPRSLLLVLDNFEQVLAAAPLLALLLASAPRLKVVATSRATVRISAEREFVVPPLPLADPALTSFEKLAASPPVQLFEQRARAVRRTFELTPENVRAVCSICARLDGLPLAIELAAARVKLLEPEEILQRLDSRLELLAAGPRDAPPRQRTLRAALDWSFQLLEPEEQVLLARLAVFVGGWTITAAERVCGLAETDLLDLLGSLVDKSLVLDLGGAERRFGMLETVREYALERLRDSRETDALRHRHLEYVVDLAELAEPELEGPEQRDWLDRLEREHDNLRAAFAYGLEIGDRERALRIGGALRRFWQVHGHLYEGRRALDAALERAEPVRPGVLAKALNGAGVLAGEQGDFAAAERFFRDCLGAARSAGDGDTSASALSNLGTIALFHDDFDVAGDHYREAARLWTATGNRRLLAAALENLGCVAFCRGDNDAALELLEQAEAIARETGHEHNLASSLRALGRALLVRGDLEAAAARLREGLAIARELRQRHGLADTLEGFAGLAVARGDPPAAATLFGAAARLREEIGARRAPDNQAWYERSVAATRAALDDEAFAAASARGAALSADEAFELAVAASDPRS